MKSSKPQSAPRADIVRVVFTGVTRADCNLAWKTFSDCRRWRKFSDFYGDIRWLAGSPWRAGSRLRIEIVQPVKTIVDHVITVSRPSECVAWIDHAMGNTMEQWVTFEPRPEGGTRVHTWAELTGPTSHVAGKPVREVVANFIEQWYERFCRECDRLYEQEYAVW